MVNKSGLIIGIGVFLLTVIVVAALLFKPRNDLPSNDSNSNSTNLPNDSTVFADLIGNMTTTLGPMSDQTKELADSMDNQLESLTQSGALIHPYQCSKCPNKTISDYLCGDRFVVLIDIKDNGTELTANRVYYLIKINKYFKETGKVAIALARSLMYTNFSDDVNCTVKFTFNGRYLVTGSVIGGRALVSECDLVFDWAKLSAEFQEKLRTLTASCSAQSATEQPSLLLDLPQVSTNQSTSN